MAFHSLEENPPSKKFGVHDFLEEVSEWELQRPCCTPRVVDPNRMLLH